MREIKRRKIHQTIWKEVIFPPEGLKQAENTARSYIRENWYTCQELIPGKLLWGLPIVTGNTERCAYTKNNATKGELCSMKGELQLPSGASVSVRMWHRDPGYMADFRVQVGCSEDDPTEFIDYFKEFADED
jgi:hypothetical protein